MANITAAQATKLNKASRANKDALLGTVVRNLQGYVGASGSYTVVAGEASASRVVITTGMAAVNGWMVGGRRSGSPLTYNVTSGSVGGTLLVVNPTGISASPIAAGDIISWLVF